MSLIDDAYELYDSRGGTMNRSTYHKAVALVLRMVLLLLRMGRSVQLDDISFSPIKRERRIGYRQHYYLPGYVPDITVASKRYRIVLRKKVKQELLDSYEEIPLP